MVIELGNVAGEKRGGGEVVPELEVGLPAAEHRVAGLHLHLETLALDAHRARIEHFERAPKLRALVKSGRIRMMHSFALENKKLLDGMQVKLVAVDNQYAHISCSHFDSAERLPYTAESSLSIDSGPVTRQAAAYVDALIELAEMGGHSKEACKTLPLYSKVRGRPVRFEAMPMPRKRAEPKKPSRQPARTAPGVSAPKTTALASRKAAPKKAAVVAKAKAKTKLKAKPKAAPKKVASAKAKPKMKMKAKAKAKAAPKKAAPKKKPVAKKKKRAA